MVDDLMLSDKLDTLSSALSGGKKSKDSLYLIQFLLNLRNET